MKKLQAVRDAILAAPLKIKAADLLTFADKGTLRSWREDGNYGFELTYTAHLIVTGYVGAPQDLFFVVLDWLHRDNADAQPDALKFTVDLLDRKTADIEIAVDITETVASIQSPGGMTLTPVADADAQAIDMTTLFPDLPPGTSDG